MDTALFIPEVVDHHRENAADLWLMRANAVEASDYRLADLLKLDERVEANIDGLRIAQTSGWSAALNDLDRGSAGDFFTVGLLAVESDKPNRLDEVIEYAYASAERTADQPYYPPDDPWRGLVSALAWVDRAHAVGAIERLLVKPRPRTRWLGIAACSARRTVRQPGLEAALDDLEPLVRARAARAIGQLGRVDLRAALNKLLGDPENDCRFWAAWSSARLGAAEGMRALTEFARTPGPQCDRALDLLLRCLSIERANAFLRPFARSSEHQRTVIWATGVIGDPLYIPWLIGQTSDLAAARTAGNAIATITGIDLAGLSLTRPAPTIIPSEPNDDPTDENITIDEDDGLVWPDPEKLGSWWEANRARFDVGTAYFLGTPKASTDWIGVLRAATQRQRHAAALELAVKRSEYAILETRARASLQRRLLSRVVDASSSCDTLG